MARSSALVGLASLWLGCAPPLGGAASSPPEPALAERATPGARDPTSTPPVDPAGELAPPRPAPVEPAPVELAPGEPVEPEAAEPVPTEVSEGGLAFEITRRVRTGAQPKSVTVSPDGTRLYVCNFGHSGRRNVSVYDTHTLERVAYVHFPGNVAELAVSADGATLYASNFARNVIEVIDAGTLRVLHEVEVGHNPKFMVIDEARGLLYVSNWSSHTVSAVDLPAQRVDHVLRTGRRPRGMALLPDGTLLVGAMWGHRVQAFAPGSTRPDREFAACENPRHLVLSPDHARLYVSCSGDRLLRWFDPLTGEPLGEAPTGRNPRTIDVSRDGRMVAIADFDSSTVSVVELPAMLHRTHAVAKSRQIVGLAIAPDEPLRIFATSWLGNELIELRPSGEP